MYNILFFNHSLFYVNVILSVLFTVFQNLQDSRKPIVDTRLDQYCNQYFNLVPTISIGAILLSKFGTSTRLAKHCCSCYNQ